MPSATPVISQVTASVASSSLNRVCSATTVAISPKSDAPRLSAKPRTPERRPPTNGGIARIASSIGWATMPSPATRPISADSATMIGRSGMGRRSATAAASHTSAAVISAVMASAPWSTRIGTPTIRTASSRPPSASRW